MLSLGDHLYNLITSHRVLSCPFCSQALHHISTFILHFTSPIFDSLSISSSCFSPFLLSFLIFFFSFFTFLVQGPRKLALASHSASFVWFMLGLLKPLAAPIAWGLDTALPEENDTLTRNDVLGLVAVHREIAQEEGYSEPFGAHEEALIKVAFKWGF